MYAIIEDSGTQIRVAKGDVVDVDPRKVGADSKTIKFERVLLVGDGTKGDSTIGTPYVAGAEVTAEIVGEVRGDKIDVIKFKRRKGYSRKYGHRQTYLRVKIDAITGPTGSKRKAPTQKKSTSKTTSKTTPKKED